MLGIVVTLVALAIATVFAWPEGVDARRLVAGTVTAQERVDRADRATLRDRPVPATAFAQRARAAGWEPVAVGTDEIHGRDAVWTVWEQAGRRVVHTVLSGQPAGRPEGSGRTGRGGVLLYGIRGDLRNVVTWTEGGRTMVLSGTALTLGDLYDLAGGR